MFGSIADAISKPFDALTTTLNPLNNILNPISELTDTLTDSLTDVLPKGFGDVLGHVIDAGLPQLLGAAVGGPAGALIAGNLTDALSKTSLGDALSFASPAGMLSLVGADDVLSELTDVGSAVKPVADAVSAVLTGGADIANNLSNMLVNTVQGLSSPFEAAQAIVDFAEKVGLEPQKMVDLILALTAGGVVGQAAAQPVMDAFTPRLPATSATPADTTPVGGSIDGANGFLFKPVSESDGNLVVLAPENLAGQIDSVVVKDANGAVLERGDFSGNANGGRDHFRFDHAGSDFGKNVTVEFRMSDGSTKSFDIPDAGKRWD